MMNPFKKIKELQKELDNVKKQNVLFISCINNYKREIENTYPTATKVIANIFKRNLNWFDYEKLPTDKKKMYCQKAQMLLDNEVFMNELNAFVLDCSKFITYEAQNWEDSEKGRYTLNGAQAFLERLENINKPEEIKDVDKKELLESI